MNIFVWDIPTGPGTPFADPLISVLDSVRVLILFCSAVSLLFLVPALRMTWTRSQTYRIGCLGMFSIYVGLTEFQRMGDYGNWRLLVGAMGSIWTAFAVIGFLQSEGNPQRAPKYLRWMVQRRNSPTSHESWLSRVHMSRQATEHDHQGKRMKRIAEHRRDSD